MWSSSLPQSKGAWPPEALSEPCTTCCCSSENLECSPARCHQTRNTPAGSRLPRWLWNGWNSPHTLSESQLQCRDSIPMHNGWLCPTPSRQTGSWASQPVDGVFSSDMFAVQSHPQALHHYEHGIWPGPRPHSEPRHLGYLQDLLAGKTAEHHQLPAVREPWHHNLRKPPLLKRAPYLTLEKLKRDGQCDHWLHFTKFHNSHFTKNNCLWQSSKKLTVSEHFWKLRCGKITRRCSETHILKSKCAKHLMGGPLFEVAMWKKLHAAVARSSFWSQMYKTLHARTTFWSYDVEKLHAAVARSTFASQNVKKLRGTDHFLKFRCGKMARRCSEKHICKWKCTKYLRFCTTFRGFTVQVN